MTTTAGAASPRSARLTDLGRRFADLGDRLEDSPVTEALPVLLDGAGIPYRYVDLDLHPQVERRLRWIAGGDLRNPVVDVGGQWLEQPTPRELRWARLVTGGEIRGSVGAGRCRASASFLERPQSSLP